MMADRTIQTAGRDALGQFAPDFAHYNDDILFGENWNNQDIDKKTRCIVTVTALVASGITDSSLLFHLQNAKSSGVTRAEIAAVITHTAFYAGWPKGWAAFNLAKQVWTEEATADTELERFRQESIFPVGKPNDAFAQYFTGQSYLEMLSVEQVAVGNVTFAPGCRNNWHIHQAKAGGGQMLLVTAGRGYYQEWGQAPRALHPGDVVHIPAGVKHWHGAAPDSWFQHLAVEVPGEDTKTQWCEPVSEAEYGALRGGSEQ